MIEIQFQNMENEVLPIIIFYGRFFHLLHALRMRILKLRFDLIWNVIPGMSSKEQMFIPIKATNILPAITTSLTLTDTLWLIVPNENLYYPLFDLKS